MLKMCFYISMSTLKASNSYSDLTVSKENTPANDSYVTKIEEYLNQQYDHAALVHFKNQTMKEVSKERENYRREIKCNSPGAYEAIPSLRSQIELIAPYTLTIERKEHKTKELKNKSTIHEKNSINSKQNSKANNNMTSKNFPVIDSIDIHVNRLVPESDTAESKNHVLLPFPYEDKDLLTQAVVTATTTTTIINSRNNANTNNNTVKDTNSILIQWNATTTATNNRADNKNTNNNAVNDSSKLLTPASASTTATNNNTNSVNANNSENNTSSKLILSSIYEERNESDKCGNAAKQDGKEKVSAINSE